MKTKIISKKGAFRLIETAGERMPYKAIKYLRDHETDEEIIQRIVKYLKIGYNWNHPDNNIDAALWYGIVAENHLDLRMVDAIIELFSKDKYIDIDSLNEQASYLVYKLCEKFGDEAIEKFIDTIEKMLPTEYRCLYLTDCIYFADKEKYGEQLLRLLDNPNTGDILFVATTLANANFTNVVPRLKELISIYEKEEKKDWYAGELEEAIVAMTQKDWQQPYGETQKDWQQPYGETRKDWEEHYRHQINNTPVHEQMQEMKERAKVIAKERGEEFNEDLFPDVKPQKPTHIRRNDPCYCGSGKKYKRCCMNK